MQLYYSDASPYSRKARVVAMEKNIPLELKPVATFDNPPDLLAVNPLCKIPALVLQSGNSICDSAMICEFFEMVNPQPVFYPLRPDVRTGVLAREALAIGVMDAAVKLAYETMRRPENLRWDVWITRQEDAIMRTLKEMEKSLPSLTDAFTIDQVTLACALGYITYRHGQLKWKENYKQLAAWYEKAMKRESMQKTAPN